MLVLARAGPSSYLCRLPIIGVNLSRLEGGIHPTIIVAHGIFVTEENDGERCSADSCI
jgi:hypothetical protein